jgi:hypothetical protein
MPFVSLRPIRRQFGNRGRTMALEPRCLVTVAGEQDFKGAFAEFERRDLLGWQRQIVFEDPNGS